MHLTDGCHNTGSRMDKVADFGDVAHLLCPHLHDEHFVKRLEFLTYSADNAQGSVEVAGGNQDIVFLA